MKSMNTGLAVAVALAAALASAPAGAGVSVRKVCAADMKTYCHGMNPFGSGLGKCMKAHWDVLSEDCRAAIREREEKRHPASSTAEQLE